MTRQRPERPRRRIGAIIATTAIAVTSVAGSALPAVADDGEIRVSGVLHEGTPGEVVYEAVAPADWNGTLILDLDFNGWSEARRDLLLDQGYAIGGNQRTQGATAYEVLDYVDNLVTTRELLGDALVAAGEDPEANRTIATGNSRGSFVARMAAQERPDIFDGAVASAGGGAGIIASWLGKADAVWALQQLVDPDAGLQINDLPPLPESGSYEQDQILRDLVDRASADDAGLARIMLAAAFEQATDFARGDEPPAAHDFETQGRQIASGFAFGNPQIVMAQIETMAGGPVVWNHGVDYADLLDRSGARDRVEWWYERAGLDLEADLAALADAPRFSADPAAVAEAERQGAYSGTGSPVFTLKTIGDSADPAPLDEAYVRTYEAAGTADDLLRAALIERSGHGTQTLAEWLTGIEVLEERLDTGAWPDTEPEALNARAEAIAEASGLAPEIVGAEGRYVPFGDLAPALRVWDRSDAGRYDGTGPAIALDAPRPSTAPSIPATARDTTGIATVSATVRDMSGRVTIGLDAIKVGGATEWAGVLDLPSDLAPRRYVIEVTATDSLGWTTTAETAFTVTR